MQEILGQYLLHTFLTLGGYMTTTRLLSQVRLPLRGEIDLTYRCTNTCRHCWIYAEDAVAVQEQELSTAAIREIVDQARAMGCREWAISGGEPLLRADFEELFAYITGKALRYTLNTNGSLITPALARLFQQRRHGAVMIALYGATAEIHDYITCTPGSFENTLRGFAYMREAGAAFITQIVPMRDNYHQYQQMVSLAQSLGPSYRLGATWLRLSAGGQTQRNQDICRQRLPADIAAQLDAAGETIFGADNQNQATAYDRGFTRCMRARQAFHVDPYGSMSFCSYAVDPMLRSNLLHSTFQHAWEVFLPALAEQLERQPSVQGNCSRCERRTYCHWCPLYAYLETRDYTASVPYLCEIAHAKRRLDAQHQQQHCRHFQLGGLTVTVRSDIPILAHTYAANFTPFQVEQPGEEAITLHHHFSLPDVTTRQLGQRMYRNGPLSVYRHERGWIYLQCEDDDLSHLQCIAEFSADHRHGDIYYPPSCRDEFQEGARTLAGFLDDQAIFARVLADHQACYLHAAGMIIEQRGFLFAGHSGAGKSTTLRMLQGIGDVISDDRNIIRRWPDGFRIHGTWHHGDIRQVSPASAPLHALCFIEQSNTNQLIRITEKREIFRRLLLTVIKPYTCVEWWQKTATLLEAITGEIPTYRLLLDTSGAVREVITELLQTREDSTCTDSKGGMPECLV